MERHKSRELESLCSFQTKETLKQEESPGTERCHAALTGSCLHKRVSRFHVNIPMMSQCMAETGRTTRRNGQSTTGAGTPTPSVSNDRSRGHEIHEDVAELSSTVHQLDPNVTYRTSPDNRRTHIVLQLAWDVNRHRHSGS